MTNTADTGIELGEVMLSIAVLYWSLHDKLDCADPGISKQERLFLLRLSAPRRMGDLAKIMQSLPSTVTVLADALEAKGLVVRRRDPDDRRAWLLELTEQGQGARRALMDRIDAALRDATGLPEADLHRFGALMLRIRDHIMADGLPKGLPF
ncbi:MarR family transcriptional regulator [Pelagivirga sediminicola]|uniref:MarR family transcriptional regulator n=1 Tax=Pelagivirga sediminicola TaxID=2170575 RepID=A0A2T7G4W8_9RHOB|nr:MarR family winged helix-turn-helix transcriptional regulator [Pelagivirga sediminicola]PVA09459.1 MarR family transcriptional regulator [Pelagivirga sediminicola]